MILWKYTYHAVLLLCCLYTSLVINGQSTCSSSALAPVFSQTFGQGSSSSSKTTVPSGFNTNYSFQSSGALNDGYYIVTPRVQNSGRNDWAVGTDHTGNSNGNMFLVNAGTGGSVFFTQQVDNLCPGSTYNFSAWLANVNTTTNTLPICGSGYVYPNVTFNIKNISGTVLATYNTGNLPLTASLLVAPNWQQYGFSFALPSGTTSLVLEMVDSYGGQPQCGNDLAIDDILFTACTPTATVSFTTGTTICAGSSTTINAAIANNPFTLPAYQWQKSTDGGTTWSNIGTAGTASSYTINSATSTDGASYRVIVGPDVSSLTSSTCITASAAVALTVASVKLNDDVIECNNGITSYSASDPYYKVTYSNSNAGNSYLWSVSSTGSWSFQGSHSPSSQYPRFQFNSSAAYTVSVQFTTNGISCSDTQIVFKNAVALASILNSKDTSICYNTGSVNLSGSISYVTNSYSWSTSGTGSFSNANSLYPTYSPSLADKIAGSINIYFTGTSTYNETGNCGSNTSKDSMILRIYPDNIGTNTNTAICSNQLLTHIPTSTQAGSTFLWTSSFTSGNGSGNTANGSGNISDLLINSSSTTAAVVSYVITPYYAGCAGTPYTLTVTINPNPVISITNNTGEICSGSAANIQFSSSLAGSSFSWTSSVISGAATGNSSNTTPSSTNTITDVITNNSITNAIVQYKITTISANGCTAIDSTTITVKPNPTTASAGADQLLCNLNSAQLNGNTPLVGTGNWSMASGVSAVLFSNASLPNSSVSGLVPGVYVFVWTISNSPCAVSRDSVSIIISPETVAGTLSANTNVCYGNNTGSLTLSGFTGNIIRWEFSNNSGTSWGSIANTNNTFTFTNLTTTTLYRAVVQSGSCSIQYSNPVTVTVDPLTVPGSLTGAITVCAGSNSGTLTLTGYTGNIIRWESSVDGGTTWPNSYAVNTSTYTFTNLTQTTAFRAVVQSGTCSVEYSSAVIVTVSPITDPGTLGNDATVCATGNSGTLSLNAYTGNIIQWELSINNGGSWATISNTSGTLNYTNLLTSTQYRVLVQSGVCTPVYSNIVTITVVPPVEMPNAGIDFAVCNVTAATLNATAPSAGSGSWSFISGPSAVSFTNAADALTTVNGLTTGIYQFEWTVSNGICANLKDTVQLTVFPATVAGTLSGSNTVCATANNGTLTLAGFTGNILHWEYSIDNGNTWTNVANTTNTLNYSNLFTTTQYRASVQSGVCTALYSNIITITVLPAVTTANAGTDTHVCFTTATILSAITPTNGTGTWTVVPGAPSVVSFTNANNPNSTVNGLVVGTYQFVWTISNGTCADSRDTVSITVDPQTIPGTLSASNTVCATSNNGTLTLAGFTGNILHWEYSTDNGNTWTNVANITNTLNYSNLSTTTQYRASVQSGVCTPVYANIITITVLPAVTPANAGSNQSICNVTGITLNGNNPTSGTGTWSVLAGAPSNVTFTNAADPTTTVSGMVAGTYQFVWTISNGTCLDSKDTMQVVIHPPSVPGNITAEATVCALSNNGTLTLSGNTGTVQRWEYSTDYGNSWTTVTNTTNTLDYTNLSTTTVFRVAVQNQNCPVLYSNLNTITVLQPVTPANAGPDTIFINGVSSYTLNGNTPSSGTGEWSVVPGATTTLNFSGITDPGSTITGLDYVHGTPPTNGKYLLVWTISNGYCPISRDTMQITVQPPTIPGVIGPDAVVCTGNNNGTLYLTDYLGNILQWELSVNNGATWSVISSTVGANQNSYTYSNLTETTLFRALVKNGVGAELYSGVAATVTVLELVTPANAGPDQLLCNTTSSTLAGNSPTSGMGTWSALAGNPTVAAFSNTADPKSVISGLTFGTYHFVWTISNGICSDSKDTVTITIQQPTVAGNISADNTVCITSNNGSLNLTGYFGSIVQTEYSIDNGITWSGISNTATINTISYTNLTQTTQYRGQIKNGVCPALFTNIVTVTVLPEPTPANAGTNQVLCDVTATTLHANTPVYGTGIWTVVPGAPSVISFTNAADPATTVNGLTYGTYRFVWTISNTLCTSSTDTVEIRVVPPTIAGNLLTSATVCATNNTNILTLTGNNGNIIRWEFSVNNGGSWNSISNTGNTFTYTNLNTTTSYRALNQNEICSAMYSNEVVITVIPPVTTANAGTDQRLCNASSTTLSANTATSGTGTWTVATGAPSVVSFTNNTDPNTTVNGLTVGVYQFIWTITNGICTGSADTILVLVDPQTVPGSLVADATVCATANNNILSLSGYTGDILRWEFSTSGGSTWNNIANTTNTLAYTNLNTTTSYRVAIQSGSCNPLYSNSVTITVLQPVTVANAGADQTRCNAAATVLQANLPSSGTGSWTYVSGPSVPVFANAGDYNTVVTGLTAGTYSFVWTISNNLCVDSKDTMQVIIAPVTVPGTLSSHATVCSGSNSGSLQLAGTTGILLHWEQSTDNGSTWTIISNSSNSYTYNNLTASTLFRVLVKNSVCATAYSNPVLITVMPQVTTAVAGLNQVICNSNTTRLNGNTPSSGVGVWSQVAGTTTVFFSDANLAGTNLSGLNTGTYQFMWTISNGVCPSSSNEVEVRIDPPTSAGQLSNDDTVCSNINSGSLSITNYTGSIIRWESSTDNGANWTAINTTQNSYTYSNLTATTGFRVLVQSGVCASLYSNTITVTVNPLTVGGHIAANDTVCVTSNNGTLQLTDYVGDLIRWESSTDNGKNWNLINYTGAQYSFNNLTTTTMFRVMVQSGVCSAAFSDSVNIVVDAATVAGTLSGANTVCYNNNSGNIILSGRLGYIVQWESSENSGANWNVLTAPLSDTLRYTNLSRNTLYRTLVKNGTCAIMYSTPIEISVVAPVTPANAGADILVCNAATSAILRGNTPAVGTGSWKQVTGPNTAVLTDPSNPNTLISGLVAGSYRFAWEISNGICVSSSDTVVVKVDQTIADFTLSGVHNCGNTVYRFNDHSRSNFGINNWKWSIAPGDTVYQKENSIRFTSEGTYTMNLSVQSNAGCINSLQAQFFVDIFEFPQVDIDAIRDVCKGQLTQLSPIVNSRDTIAMLLWNLGNGTRSTDSLISVRYLVDGQYTVRLTATTVNNCFDSAYKAMTVHPLPVINITPNSIICKGDSIRIVASGAMNYIWFDQLNNITASGPDNKIIRPAGSTTVRVVGYDQHSCSETKSTSIRVIQPLKMFAAQGDTLCIGESKQLMATGAGTYKWYPETGLSSSSIANPVARPVETTVYNVVGKDDYSCFTDTVKIKVVVGRPTPISIGRDTVITAGTSFRLGVLSTNAINGGNDHIRKWRWGGAASISCPTCPAPEVKLSNDACISCIVVNNYGCVSTDTLCIKTLCPTTELFVPNAFSPDGDGINDVLLVQGKGIKLIKSFRIYNRWGQLVFEKANFSPGDPAYAWNGIAFGKAVTPDVFVYVSEVICEKGLPTIFKGNITILK
ncbi:MAG: PKD-like domain-containing protein [Bacteroidota bacterium]